MRYVCVASDYQNYRWCDRGDFLLHTSRQYDVSGNSCVTELKSGTEFYKKRGFYVLNYYYIIIYCIEKICMWLLGFIFKCKMCLSRCNSLSWLCFLNIVDLEQLEPCMLMTFLKRKVPFFKARIHSLDAHSPTLRSLSLKKKKRSTRGKVEIINIFYVSTL